MGSWDTDSFFTLHDYNADSVWQIDEIQRTYGLMDPSNKALTEERKSQITHELMALLDGDGDGTVSRAEWSAFISQGHTLPDMGTGPGHHGDDEYEYEIHHWEKYHDENTKLEDLTHPEDIEHFKMHEEQEKAQERQEAMDKRPIIEENIPSKFRRRS
ncbi:EF-hand-like domain protein [Ophiocordyceps sinensis CO18]|nr:EF-hand-like domain protein [Ophiocordyceps sinensis CO18]